MFSQNGQPNYPDTSLGTVRKSVHHGRYSFPGIDDYISYFLAKGDITSPQELWQRNDLLASMQRHWHIRGQNGCGFAQVVADTSREYGWENVVFNYPVDQLWDETLKAQIGRVVCEREDTPSTQLLSLLFPQIRTLEELVGLTRLLKSLDRFRTIETTIGEYTAIGLQFIQKSGIPAWFVGFGPFSHFPNTRQSPITEAIVRPKTKPDRMFHRLNQNRAESHLADVTLQFDDTVAEQIYTTTVGRVRSILGQAPDKFSSAKTVFTVPTSLWIQVL